MDAQQLMQLERAAVEVMVRRPSSQERLSNINHFRELGVAEKHFLFNFFF